MLHRTTVWIFLCLLARVVHADIRVLDDTGHEVVLQKPAKRIVSLAPHITETLYAAGAGPAVVGVVSYSDYPEAAKSLPNVGNYDRVDLEKILFLHPDLVIAWQSGNDIAQLDALQAHGVVVFRSEPHRLPDIAATLERFGKLAGTGDIANRAAASFRQRLDTLSKTYASRARLRGFYQIWHQPIMTVNGQHLISDVMSLCGVDNVFAEQSSLVPQLSQESVILANPQIITGGGMAGKRPEWLDAWKTWPQIDAVKYLNLFNINPDIMQRHAPRILDGAEEYCRQADIAREHIQHSFH